MYNGHGGITMINILKEKTIEKDECNIHYWVSRKDYAPWLIFLHGAGADHRMFKDQIPLVFDKFSIMLWDARGHGLSRPMGKDFSIKLLIDDLTKIMDVESIGSATLVGHSMGGNTAQEMVFYHPDRVKNLVLIDCTCNTMKLSFVEKLLLKITPFVLSLYPWELMAKTSANVSSVNPEIQSYLVETFKIVGKADFEKVLIKTTKCLHYNKNYRINKPMLLVCGELDNTGNIRKAALPWSNREPMCDFHMIKNASHCSHQDNPHEFNKLLMDFLIKQYQRM